MLRSVLFALLAALPLAALGQDVMTLSLTSGSAGATVRVPLSLQDVAGTPLGSDAAIGSRIQGIAFRVAYDPSKVTGVTFARAGALQNVTPLYERTSSASGSIGYVGSFEEATQPIPFGSGVARIGTLSVQLAPGLPNGSVVALTFDASNTVLSNQAGTLFESPYNRKLGLGSGSITVGGAATTTALSSSVNPSTSGQMITFTANVTSGTAGTINGTMTFFDGANTIGYANVSNGSAAFSTSSLSNGSHAITAAFEGSPSFLPSTSPVVNQTVTQVLDAPLAVNAGALSATSVSLTWSGVTGATSYEIRRRSNGGYALVGTSPSASFNDDTAVGGTTYLYVVRAISATGSSADSAPDVATTILFADDPLVSYTTTINAAHIAQLRTAVNAMRAAAGQGAASFTDPALTAGTSIRAVHIQELRSALSAARALLGLPAVGFTDAGLAAGTVAKAAHVQELRNAVK
ncbi:MAG TPA: Ig-like domain repeat protein [Vicinamibacterales bacterium]